MPSPLSAPTASAWGWCPRSPTPWPQLPAGSRPCRPYAPAPSPTGSSPPPQGRWAGPSARFPPLHQRLGALRLDPGLPHPQLGGPGAGDLITRWNVRTAPNGTFRTTVTIPARLDGRPVPAGDYRLTAVLGRGSTSLLELKSWIPVRPASAEAAGG
ncbi:protein of unknown function [Candidatus Hydrogenisulfobacillus filiaventi]|uniref:Uncharacterized protein n=1 Tax=Candidatus Hydrogenisulfobacillus filiaventi TaxID=2707344 RepID=A0A6F8ZI84_9FIRM|nr:protein of unknown function [Candidatus Hydrogenisulfobacillus filiaventi]